MFRQIIRISAVLLLCMTFSNGVLANTSEGAPGADQQKKMGLEEQWGVKIESLRISAAGNLLDFRYRIIDPEKASYLFDRNNNRI